MYISWIKDSCHQVDHLLLCINIKICFGNDNFSNKVSIIIDIHIASENLWPWQFCNEFFFSVATTDTLSKNIKSNEFFISVIRESYLSYQKVIVP